MNDDLISREALKKVMWDEAHFITTTEFGKEEACFGLTGSEIEHIIDNAPTVESNKELYEKIETYKNAYRIMSDAFENEVGKNRLRGEWIDEGQYAEGHSEHAYICKNCGYQIIVNSNMIFEERYCKCCGADMRVKSELNDELNELKEADND